MSQNLFDDLEAIDHKLKGAIVPRKWMSLEAAHNHVLFGMAVPRRASTRETDRMIWCAFSAAKKPPRH